MTEDKTSSQQDAAKKPRAGDPSPILPGEAGGGAGDLPPGGKQHRSRSQSHHKGLGLAARFRNYLLAGILVTAPIGITVALAWVVIDFVDRNVLPLIPREYNPETYLPFGMPGLGLLLIVILLTLIGAAAAGYVGRMGLRLAESAMDRLPILRSVYGAIKQILETVLAQQSNAFRQVVLVEYPRRGIWSLGFVSSVTTGEVQNVTARRLVNVFLPTTPNPTSGFLLFVPEEDLHVLDMTVEEGVKMVVSGGLVTPPDRRPPEIRAEPLIE